MPIYKVASPQPFFGAKFRGFEVSTSATAASHDHNGRETRLVHEDNAGQNKDTASGHTIPSPEAQHEIERTQVVPGRKETFMEKEVREQLRREAELATVRGSPSKQTFSSTEDPHMAKLNIQLISSTDENGGRNEQNHHLVSDSVHGSSKDQVVVEERTVVVTSQDGDGGIHRTTTTTTTTTTGGGGSGVKTGKEGTVGGSWILHELQAQAAREEELRKHRKDMGWQVEGHHDEEGQMGQPGWGHMADVRAELALDVVDTGSVEHPPVVPDILVEGPDHRSDGTYSSSWDQKSPVAGRRHSAKVQPFEDVERIQSEVQMVYVPQNEAPIEREIRKQREREDALRLARGIVLTVSNPSPDIEVEILRPRPVEEGGTSSYSATGLGLSMRKFAESRLRTELEREKKRELDLLKEGKIIVLSADRTPEAMTFVEVISPEKAELRELSKMRSAERMGDSTDMVDSREMAWQDMTSREAVSKEVASREMASKNMAPKEMVSKNVASKDVTSRQVWAPVNATYKETTPKKVVLVELAQQEHLDPIHVEVSNGHMNGDKGVVEAKVDLPSYSPPKSETRLTATRSVERSGRGMKLNQVSPNSYSEEDVQKILLTVAEQRIEEEIAETKKRELELRESRKHRVSAESTREPEPEDVKNNAHAQSVVSSKVEINNNKAPSPEPIGDGHRHDDATEVHVVTVTMDTVDFGDDRQKQSPDGQGGIKSRRLALIDQWERGIIQRSD